MKRSLPKTFFWGNSVSSMQTEGAWNEDGKGLSVYDIRSSGPHTSDWHTAIDEYHRYEEDLDLLQAMHMNMYRIQISWSRVCPDGDGEFNEAGIAYYERLFAAMKARGIEPMVCLYHFDMPLALAQKYHGFWDRHVVDSFVRFGKAMIDRFHEQVKYWIVFNEHNLYFQDEVFKIAGYDLPDHSLKTMYRIFHHTVLAHAQIANYLHQNYPDLKIGGMLAYVQAYPETASPQDAFKASELMEFLYYAVYDLVTGKGYPSPVKEFMKRQQITLDMTSKEQAELKQVRADFLAFSYYSSQVLAASQIPAGTAPNRYLNYGSVKNPYLKTNDWGWSIDPLGFRKAISEIYNRYQLPVFPIENGIGLHESWDGKHMIEDDERIAYHKEHIKALKDAVFLDGAEVLGYLGWGLIDIPSSQGDVEKRYGAVYVNRSNHDLKDLARVPKKSFYWFQKVLADNGDEL